MSTAVEAPHIPLSERINFRMILLGAVVLFLIGYPVYVYLDSVISGGIKHHGDVIEVDLKAMSTYPLDQMNGTLKDIPEKWRALDGKKIEVYGEMWDPQSAADGTASFQLCYSIAKCCFSGPPQVQHFVDTHVAPGTKNVEFVGGLVRAVGTLHVKVKKGAEKIESVYQLDLTELEAAG